MLFSDELKSILKETAEFNTRWNALKRNFKRLFRYAIFKNQTWIEICLHKSQLQIFINWLDTQGEFYVKPGKKSGEYIQLKISLFLLD
jgi:hypothetical protein